MAKKNSREKKKIDWKKVLTLVVVVALIVLKLMYGNDGGEDAGESMGSVSTESSQSVDVQLGSELPSVESSETAGTATPAPDLEIPDMSFRNDYLLDQHYKKHGIDMGFSSAEEYEAAACKVIANPDTLHKIEAEDGDDVYYLESTNEFVVVSKDGYIRTYFFPDDGIKYYNRQ